MSPVALVLVSHSALLAQGTAELAAAMAPSVHIGVAGGLPDGGLGTSFDLVDDAVQTALTASQGRGVAILTDLGSATLTVDTVLEFADDPGSLRFADGPLVEGAVAAAVAAQQGGNLEAVSGAVAEAGRQWCGPSPDQVAGSHEGPAVVLEVTITDPAGIHARPAAQIAATASAFDADVQIDGVSAGSMLELMALGRQAGDKVKVSATGNEAAAAAQAVADAITIGSDKANRP